MGKLTQEVLQKLKLTAESSQQRYAEQMREQDQQWRYWFAQGGMFEALIYPELGKPPSQRTPEERREVLLREIMRKHSEDCGK